MELKSRLIFHITKMAMRCYGLMGMKVAIEGLHHVPSRGGAILVANHRSMIDGPLLYSLMGRMVYSFIKADYFWHALVRWYLRGGGGIPIKSGALHRSTIKEAHRLLQQGDMLMIFPEGQIHDGHGVLPFNSGFVKLAMINRVPVIPISIVGSEEALPNAQWRWIPRPAHIKIVVSESVDCSKLNKTTGQIDSTSDEVCRTILQSWLKYKRVDVLEVGNHVPYPSSMIQSGGIILNDTVHGGE